MSSNQEPVAVTNLRRIWNLKKSEMQITQKQAAQQLGWTQGAFSQYLNNITHLNPAAVIKLANFLGVDPNEIDPDINNHLPHLVKYEVRFAASAPDTRIKGHMTYIDTLPHYFMVLLDEEIDGAPSLPNGSLAMCRDAKSDQRVTKSTTIPEPYYLVRLNSELKLKYVAKRRLPPVKRLQTKWIVHGFITY
jgi:transcriptional regulator with XRE-family HTH domain